MSIKQEDVRKILEMDEFKALVRKRVSVSLIFTAIILIVYFGFILTIAFNKEALAAKIGEHMTIGLPIGIGVIIFAWLLTGAYTRWANNNYDGSVEELKKHITDK